LELLHGNCYVTMACEELFFFKKGETKVRPKC
jgi:hypothetical protein